jgi:hypothetical protein
MRLRGTLSCGFRDKGYFAELMKNIISAGSGALRAGVTLIFEA